MNKRLTAEQYDAEIKACADWVDIEVRVRGRDRATYLRKVAEAHPWTVDLGVNLEVLRITRNDNAYHAAYGPMLSLNFADAIYKMALLAFQTDVSEALDVIEAGRLCSAR